MPRLRPLLLLALLGPAGALTLQNSSVTEAIDAPWSFWKQPPKREKRALLVIMGLLRGVDQYWAKLHKNFVVPNEREGYKFHIVLHTSLSVNCSETNIVNNRQKWCDYFMKQYGTTPELRRKSIQKLFAPYDPHLVDTEDTCWVKPGEKSPGEHSTTAYLQGDWRFAGCSGTMHFASRGAQALDALKGQTGFHKVVFVRTDNSFEKPDFPGLDLPLFLDEACSEHPGVNIIGNRNHIPETYYGRDYDHAWMLCDGSRAGAFREAIAAFGLSCGASCWAGQAPRCPTGYCLKHVYCLENICQSATILERARVPFGTMDDYMLCAAQLPAGRGGEIHLMLEPGDRDGQGRILL